MQEYVEFIKMIARMKTSTETEGPIEYPEALFTVDDLILRARTILGTLIIIPEEERAN